MADDPDDETAPRGWDTSRPWRTSRLPELVSIAGASEILGKHPTSLARWLKPGSGAHTAWGGFGPDQTFMITPVRIGSEKGEPIWVREDVERFAREIAGGRKPKAPKAVRST